MKLEDPQNYCEEHQIEKNYYLKSNPSKLRCLVCLIQSKNDMNEIVFANPKEELPK